jgi:hypothetical protein
LRLLSLPTVLACLGFATAGAQAPARYRVARDTLRYEMDNPYRMYWVRGTDTLGLPQHELSVETHLWRGSEAQPEVVIRQLSLNVGRSTRTDTFGLAPNGRVEAINHRPPSGAQRIDLLLRLPSSPLGNGTRWTDTVQAIGKDRGGDEWYEVVREYRVVRLFDTLGTRGVADVAAQGTIRMRFGFWIDSATGKAAWIDVVGPVKETYLFDTAQGRLLRRSWTMDLRGRGVGPSGPDTIPAGLRSEEVLTLSNSPRVRFLLTPLPGADTAISVNVDNDGAVLLHTVARTPQRIVASLSRNDGMVGVASAEVDAARVKAYDATWAEAAAELRIQRVVVRKDSLVLQRTGKRDSVFAVPAASWGVADYSMQELLAPMLLAVPRDGAAHPFAVFRPYAAHWDTGTVVARERGGLVLVVLRLSEKNGPETVLLTPDGDYLFGENSGPTKARRVPTDTARQKQLQAALKRLNGGDS